MAKKTGITKDQVLAAALALVRASGEEAVSAGSLAAQLDCTPQCATAPHGSVDAVMDAVRAYAQESFAGRIRTGLGMNPPFKGFGIALLWFAIDEPQLFRIAMEAGPRGQSFQEFVDSRIGFKQECVQVIGQTFHIGANDALLLYYQLVESALGIAFAIVSAGCQITVREASLMFGRTCRAFLMEIRAGFDDREGFVPSQGTGPGGSVGTYVDKGIASIQKQSRRLLLNTLVSQNHLLQDLHMAPRYVRDKEWTELERVLRNTFEVTPDSLKARYPSLTHGDIRLILLSLFQFTTSEGAALLGISAPSVTKARQRLKGKIGGAGLESLLESL